MNSILSGLGVLLLLGASPARAQYSQAGLASSGANILTSPVGTAAAPSITSNIDATTGWFWPASGAAALSTSGSERLRVNASGNVGIGITSPAFGLDVVRTAGVHFSTTATANYGMGLGTLGDVYIGPGQGDPTTGKNQLTVRGAGTGTNQTVSFVDSGGNVNWLWQDNGLMRLANGSGTSGIQADGPLIIRTGGATERLRMDSVGHLEFSGTAPTLGTCGTTPAITGTDQAGTITIGTSPGTSCAITFAGAWTNSPKCFADDSTTAITLRNVETTTTLTINGSFVGGDTVDYVCFGRR